MRMQISGGLGAALRSSAAATLTVVLAALIGAPHARALTPVGDCNDDGLVVINELVLSVTVALDTAPLSACPPADADGDGTVLVSDVITAVNEASKGGFDPDFRFTRPVEHQLSLIRNVGVVGVLPEGADASTLTLYVDGVEMPGVFAGGDGVVGEVTAGAHVLQARVRATRGGALVTLVANTTFEAVDLEDPERCEVLNNAACLLPYPSSRFLEPADTPTGLRLAFPEGTIPKQNGAPLQSAPYRVLDGFSPTVQILMHFPGGVDVVRSNASRLLPETRTYDARSLESDSPTVLIDAASGERILHFVEVDARATTPDRQVLFLRPARSLLPGHRYIVAVRSLLHADGTPVVAEPAFAALRDEQPSDIPAIESRRAAFADLFNRLAAADVERAGLVLAFDFTVQSDEGLTGQMLSMRDQAFAYLDAHAGEQTFTVTRVEEFDCDVPGESTLRFVEGTYNVPLFLVRDPVVDRAFPGTLNLDVNGQPLQNGITTPPFTIAIPCGVRDGSVAPPVVVGHGLLGDGRGFVRELRDFDLNYIGGATDWWGLASDDLNEPDPLNSFIAAGVVLNLNNMNALADRLRQGQLNTLVLARMMKLGMFNVDPAFQVNGTGAFPGPQTEEFYVGGSLGGIMGLMFSALSPDVRNAFIDVGAINFSFLLQRATPFTIFAQALQFSGITDPIDTALLLGITHELWVRGEPAAYATHITENPLPGSNTKNVLMAVALYDQEVSNQASEIAARTLNLPSLEGSLTPGLVGIPDLPGPLSSAYVVYDTASFDPTNPAHAPFIPALANIEPTPNRCDPHPRQVRIPAAFDQLIEFLQPGGMIRNFCDGICDAGNPTEIPFGDSMRCDPLG
jgi:hypothetical protein